MKKIVIFYIFIIPSFIFNCASNGQEFRPIAIEDPHGCKVKRATDQERSIWIVYDPKYDSPQNFNSLEAFTEPYQGNTLHLLLKGVWLRTPEPQRAINAFLLGILHEAENLQTIHVYVTTTDKEPISILGKLLSDYFAFSVETVLFGGALNPSSSAMMSATVHDINQKIIRGFS